MSKIVIVRFQYNEHLVGDVVDLGEEKNKSMVSLQRAVWWEEGKNGSKNSKTDSTPSKEEIKVAEETGGTGATVDQSGNIVENKTPAEEPKKEFFKNDLKENVQAAKAETIPEEKSTTSKDTKPTKGETKTTTTKKSTTPKSNFWSNLK